MSVAQKLHPCFQKNCNNSWINGSKHVLISTVLSIRIFVTCWSKLAFTVVNTGWQGCLLGWKIHPDWPAKKWRLWAIRHWGRLAARNRWPTEKTRVQGSCWLFCKKLIISFKKKTLLANRNLFIYSQSSQWSFNYDDAFFTQIQKKSKKTLCHYLAQFLLVLGDMAIIVYHDTYYFISQQQ